MNNKYNIDFESLDKSEVYELINYMIGLPDDIVKHIKFNFNKLDKRVRNKEVVLHKKSPLINYYNKDSINIQKYPTEKCTYQYEYCKTLDKIDIFIKENQLNSFIAIKLKNILDMKCYNESNFLNVEKAILSLLSQFDDIVLKSKMSFFISIEILPYKFHVYDVFTKIIWKDITGDSISVDNLLFLLNESIIDTSLKYSNYSDAHDLAILIYIYFKFLGLSDYLKNEFKTNVAESESLLYRFKLLLHTSTNCDWVSIYDDINNYIYNETPITEAVHRLVSPKNYNIFKSDNTLDFDDSDKVCKIGKFILLLQDNSELKLNKDMFIYHICRVLNQDELIKYINIQNYDDIYFDLTDDDCTRIMKSNNMENFGTLFDTSDEESKIKYIGKHNNIWYIFFKNIKTTNIIYGISIFVDKDNNRNIFKLEKNKTYFYKYIPEF